VTALPPDFRRRTRLLRLVSTRPRFNLGPAAIWPVVVRWAGRNQQRNRLREILQPLTSRCNSRL